MFDMAGYQRKQGYPVTYFEKVCGFWVTTRTLYETNKASQDISQQISQRLIVSITTALKKPNKQLSVKMANIAKIQNLGFGFSFQQTEVFLWLPMKSGEHVGFAIICQLQAWFDTNWWGKPN